GGQRMGDTVVLRFHLLPIFSALTAASVTRSARRRCGVRSTTRGCGEMRNGTRSISDSRVAALPPAPPPPRRRRFFRKSGNVSVAENTNVCIKCFFPRRVPVASVLPSPPSSSGSSSGSSPPSPSSPSSSLASFTSSSTSSNRSPWSLSRRFCDRLPLPAFPCPSSSSPFNFFGCCCFSFMRRSFSLAFRISANSGS
ncbi:hypothetical protein Vretifemale_4161, partial [Volvox reticuliferus]